MKQSLLSKMNSTQQVKAPAARPPPGLALSPAPGADGSTTSTAFALAPELDTEQIKQVLTERKKRGTHLFKAQDYVRSIEEYTSGIEQSRQALAKAGVGTTTMGRGEDSESTTTADSGDFKAFVLEKHAAMLGNRALCHLQLGQPKRAFEDCEACLKLFPLGRGCSAATCKYAYRMAVAAEKMGLDGYEKESCLRALYLAAERLKALDMPKESEAAYQLHFRWSCHVSAESLKNVARSFGFEIDEDLDHPPLSAAVRNNPDLNTSGDELQLQEDSHLQDGNHDLGPGSYLSSGFKSPADVIPKNSDYFKVGNDLTDRYVTHARSDTSQGAGPEAGQVGSDQVQDAGGGDKIKKSNAPAAVSEKDDASIPSHLRSKIDLQAMKLRLEKIVADTDKALKETLGDGFAGGAAPAASSSSSAPAGAGGESSVTSVSDNYYPDPEASTTAEEGDGEGKPPDVALSPTSRLLGKDHEPPLGMTRRIGEFVPIALPEGEEDSDADDEDDEDVDEKTLPELEKKKLEVFQEFARRKQQKADLLARWRDYVPPEEMEAK